MADNDPQFRDVNESFAQFLPEDPVQYLVGCSEARVVRYTPGTIYEKSFVDDDGYEWRLHLNSFSSRDDNLSGDRFIAKETQHYISYRIELTEEQRQELERFCNCPLHTKDEAAKRPGCCSGCFGCLYTEFAQTRYIVQAIRMKKQEQEEQPGRESALNVAADM